MVWPDGPGPFKGTQQAGRWPRPLTGSARVLLLTTQVIATRSVVPGHRRIILTPLADPGGKAALRSLRTALRAHLTGAFCPCLCPQTLEIHPVFLRFGDFDRNKILSAIWPVERLRDSSPFFRQKGIARRGRLLPSACHGAFAGSLPAAGMYLLCWLFSCQGTEGKIFLYLL